MPNNIRSVAVFCGTRAGDDPAHREAARRLGEGLARAGITLVYGGGGIGLMGAVAEAAIGAGGRVRGVIPEFLTRVERPYPALAELEVTSSMHTRKTRMFEMSDAFITLSGGLGTLDETVEIITWRQLGLHSKPVLICDVEGSARPFLATIEAAVAAEFLHREERHLYEVLDGVAAVLQRLARLHPVAQAEPERM